MSTRVWTVGKIRYIRYAPARNRRTPTTT